MHLDGMCRSSRRDPAYPGGSDRVLRPHIRFAARQVGAASPTGHTERRSREMNSAQESFRQPSIQVVDLQDILLGPSYHDALQRAAEAIARAVPSSNVTILTLQRSRRVHFEAAAQIDPLVVRRTERSINTQGLPKNLVDVIRSRKSSVIEDLSSYADWRDPTVRDVSWAGFPILLHGRVIAIINVQTRTYRITPAALKAIEPIVSTISLVIRRYQQERELTERGRELNVLYQITLAASRPQETGEMLRNVLRLMGRILPYEHVEILVYDADHNTLVLTANQGCRVNDIGTELSVDGPQGITVRAFHDRRPVIVHDTKLSKEYVKGAWKARSELAMPLVVGDRCVGVLNCESNTTNVFTRADIRLLSPFVSTMAVLIDSAEKTQLLERQATHDGLTGFLNRRMMDETVEAELRRARRYHRDVSVAMLDLDEFKAINDRLGHREGDRLLRVFSDCVRRVTRSSDYVFRYGGDEFLLILPETSREDAERLLTRLEATGFPELTTALGQLTFSAGIATLFTDPDASDLIKQADDRLYTSKRLGMGRVTSS